jgi:hypothetical protein
VLVEGSELHPGGVVSVEQFVVQVEGGVQSAVQGGLQFVVQVVAGVQFVVQVVVGVVPPLPLVLPAPLFEAWRAGPCRRKGTRKAPIPATIRAIAPTLRFVDESILCFSYLQFLGVEHEVRGPSI